MPFMRIIICHESVRVNPLRHLKHLSAYELSYYTLVSKLWDYGRFTLIKDKERITI